jgi:hypothetical protein
MSTKNLVPPNNGMMTVYDAEALKRCIEESELTDEIRNKALKAISDSPHSLGKDFPTFNIILVLSREFNLRTNAISSVLEVISKAEGITKEISIKK